MKSRIKKLITIALATTMLLGATLTVNAAVQPKSYTGCGYCKTVTPHDTCSICGDYYCRICGLGHTSSHR